MTALDEVKQRLDIVDVISQYASLKKSGRNFKALCPFHTEKTPSFIVFPERQSWRCFGACASGGDAFSFVMKVENLGFSDTLKLLASRAGVSLPERGRQEQSQAVYQINQAAADCFRELLRSPQGRKAMDYLKDRGVSPEAISAFQLGLSPGGRAGLKGHLISLGYSESQVQEAGLLYRREDGTSRDMFRGRLMIPIHDGQGRIVGFGGRSLDGSDPKYLNSPRTPIFDKSRILFGLHLAGAAIREQSAGVIVEGYMDVIAAHQWGFKNVVASMGTALTEQQVAQLRGLASTYVLALDPDAAGREATLRSLEASWRVFERQAMARETQRGVALYQRQQMTLRIAALPPGKDPDRVIRDDPAEWSRLIAEAMPLMDYLLTAMASRFDLATDQGKAQAAEALFPVIAAIENPYEQDRYFRRLAEVLGVTSATLEASVGHPREAGARRGQRRPPPAASVSPFTAAQRDPLEEYTLALLLRHPHLRQRVPPFAPDYFHGSENREVFTRLLESSTIDLVRGSVDPTLQDHLQYLLSKELPPIDWREGEADLEQCLKRLEQRHLKELKTQEEILLSEEEGPLLEPDMREQILARNNRLRELFSQASPTSASGGPEVGG